MSSDAQRFAVTVLAAFRGAGLFTDQEIVAAGGPSTTTLTKLRKVAEAGGTMPVPRGDTLKKIDRAAVWEQGSARKLWYDGTDPQPYKSPLREALGVPEPSPEDRHRQDRLVRSGTGLEAWVAQLADRVLELEERLDLVESELAGSNVQVRDDRAFDPDTDDPVEFIQQEPIAARRGHSEGQTRRKVQDEAGEGNQDNAGGTEPA